MEKAKIVSFLRDDSGIMGEFFSLYLANGSVMPSKF